MDTTALIVVRYSRRKWWPIRDLRRFVLQAVQKLTSSLPLMMRRLKTPASFLANAIGFARLLGLRLHG